ncbi:type II toxin-antitoxin system HicB family antitoxin [Aquitalea sp. FJL05]|uniref:type II toxin-antitoxin system HicB family antitoxin n=1 Tax=Aquitalea sp. FJL05 TaxID=2153366 RepID=UPI000F5A29AA|nr:type II toxin-antitoxin system HicB family antitoxin [Aquitalea sp. FJL05]
MLRYAACLAREGGMVTVSFPDHPDVLTYGDSREDALAQGRDALLTQLMICQQERRVFALPSAPSTLDAVDLPMMAALKVFLHNAMVEKGWRKVDLARALGWANSQVERVLDPRYQSRLPLIEEALHALGKDVQAQVVDLAA